jgi:diguanylate cyclase (GGDEF)-like protein/PAS domain S-box-containing protein
MNKIHNTNTNKCDPLDNDTNPVTVNYKRLLRESEKCQFELKNQLEELKLSHVKLIQSHDDYVTMFETAPIAYLSLSISGEIQDINNAGCELLGITKNTAIGCCFKQHIADKDLWIHFFDSIMIDKNNTQKHSIDIDFILNESIRHGKVNCRLKTTLNGTTLCMMLDDITDRNKRFLEEKISAVIFNSQVGMIVTDAQANILRVNQSFCNITGFSEHELLGKNPRIFSSGRHTKEFYTRLWAEINKLGFWSGEIWNKRKNGELYPEHLHISAVKNSFGTITNYIATVTDIKINKDAADEIQLLAFYDTLTRLPNKRLLLDRLQVALSNTSLNNKYGAVLFIDLDNFKYLNESLGYVIGDTMLQQVAWRIEKCLRVGHTVARFGGDEFVVMLHDLDVNLQVAAAQVELYSNKILTSLIDEIILPNCSYNITASIGATLFNQETSEVDDILRQADIAMYQAKKAGKNTIRFFDPKMQAYITSRVYIESKLRTAIDNNEFTLHYQAQVDENYNIIGAEALLRWNSNKQELEISPIVFIPVAEDTGLIIPIGYWVLEAACKQLTLWKDDVTTQKLTISVNVSAKQFLDPNFVSNVHKLIHKYQFDTTLLKLEPTESILLENVDTSISVINQLRKLGIHFSLDDFGTGFSSLQYLKILPLNQLKIDKSFVRDLQFSNNDKAIVKTIIAMAQGLGLEVIAEGVETEEQRQTLFDYGCKYYQGYLFSKPLSIEDFTMFVAKGVVK